MSRETVRARLAAETILTPDTTGYALWIAQTATDFSGVVYQALTDGQKAVHERCLDAIKARGAA